MRARGRVYRGFVPVVALLLAGASCGSEEKACTAIGCADSVRIGLASSETWATLETATLKVCRNTICVSGPLDSPSVPANVGQGPGGGSTHVDVRINEVDGKQEIDLEYWPGPSESFAQGDHFTVTLTAESGQLLQSLEANPTYTLSYPNGRDCAPACMHADILTR